MGTRRQRGDDVTLGVVTASSEPRTIRSFCRICIANCGTIVTVDPDGTVLSVRGDADHPLSHGYLCPKGRALKELHHDPQRIRGAFLGRRGARTAVTHDEAVAHAARTLQRIVAEHGTESVGFLMGSGGFIDPAGGVAIRKFRQRLGTNQNYSTATVDSIAKVVVTSLMAGTTALVPHVDPDVELLVLIGSNPVVSHGQSTGFSDPVEAFRAVGRRGGELWVVDPRRTESANHADHHLAVRPGTDYALFAYLVRDVLDRRRDAIAAGDLDVEALTAAVEPFDLDRAATVTGVDPDLISGLADAIDRRGRLAAVTGTGNTMSPTGNATEWLTWALMILTDSFEKPGGMWFNPGFLTRLDERLTLPATVPMPSSPAMPSVLNRSGEWPASLIPAEIESGRLRALVVFGCNIVCAMPDTALVEKALDELDALIVLDLFDNETGGHATHLFASPDQLERPDLTPLDLYVSARASHFTEAVVSEPDDRWPCWRTVCEIAWAMGIDLLGDPAALSSEAVLARVARGVSLDDLRAADGAMVLEATAVHDWARSRLPTGGWDLAPAPLVAQLASITETEGLRLAPRRQLRRENSRAYREGERMEALLHPADAGQRGIVDGASVLVTSTVGSLEIPVRVTDHVSRGTVSIPHGYGEANVNRLVSADALDEHTGMPFMSGTVVDVRGAL